MSSLVGTTTTDAIPLSDAIPRTTTTTNANYDVIVVGLGAMGAATAYQLASCGVRVLGIDSLSPPHTHGSSHGDTRITRQAIGEGLAYVPLAVRSHQIWREIEAATGADLLTTNGALILSHAGNTAGFHHRTHFLEQTVAAADAFAIPHEVLEADAIAARFPQFHLGGDELGYYEPGAGFLRPEACIEAELTLACARGAEIHRDEPMQRFTIEPHGATVVTSRGTYSTAKLILSVGPWLPALLGEPIRSHLRVHRQVMHWFAADPPLEQLAPNRCPVYIWETGAARAFYGFPAIDGPDGGVKVATEQYEVTTNPATVDREVNPQESSAFFDDTIGGRLPQLQRHCIRAVVCLYTTTSDSDFIVDWHPGSDDILVVSPCSGHGFKHSAALGEAAAELVTTGTSNIDMSSFSLARFTR